MPFLRREALLAGGAACALAALPRLAAAEWEPSQRYPDPLVRSIDPSFDAVSACTRQGRADRHGNALGRRPGVVRRRALSAVERHSQQPHHAVGRDDRRRERLPRAVEQLERQHAATARDDSSPASTTPARHAHRIRRRHHRARRPLRRQAAQLAQRHRVQVRRVDLVHGSAVRRARLLRRARGARPSCRPTSTAGTPPRGLTVVTGDVNRPNGLAFSPDEKRLYVVEAGVTPRVIRAYDVAPTASN